jgi:D-glycero-D-manno-heptose 1,7-bisphosphate phosphatase
MKYAIFFERDGMLNHVQVKGGHPITPSGSHEFEVNEAVPRRELERMHEVLKRRLHLDDVLVCPHDEGDQCNCRKPKPGLMFEAAFKWHLDLEHSFVISDRWQDAAAAHGAGCLSILVQSPWIGTGHHDFVVPNLEAAVRKILQLHVPSEFAMGQVCAA